MRRLIRAYGTRIGAVLGDATSGGDLGRVLGADLTEAELRYLMRNEWARTAEDVVWRRSKLGLRMTPAEIVGVDDAMRRIGRDEMAA
jgi:glycerol-3-phosphate dehydrogenase